MVRWSKVIKFCIAGEYKPEGMYFYYIFPCRLMVGHEILILGMVVRVYPREPVYLFGVTVAQWSPKPLVEVQILKQVPKYKE